MLIDEIVQSPLLKSEPEFHLLVRKNSAGGNPACTKRSSLIGRASNNGLFSGRPAANSPPMASFGDDAARATKELESLEDLLRSAFITEEEYARRKAGLREQLQQILKVFYDEL